MKIYFIFFLNLAIAFSSALQAQPWSEVGTPGITPNPTSNTSRIYESGIAIFSATRYLVYIDNNLAPIVMKNVSGTWSTLPSLNIGTNVFASYPSLAVDPSGIPYVSYISSLDGHVVKKFDGTSWLTVGTTNFTNSNAVDSWMVLDPTNGTPYVCYSRSSTTQKISVKKFNGTSWVAVGLSDFSSQTNYVRMAVSATGVPYVAYIDLNNSNKVSVQKFDGTNWIFVGPAGFTSMTNTLTPDIAIDALGVPYVVFSTAVGNKANVMKFDGTNWVSVGPANFSAGSATETRIKMNASSKPYIIFKDFVNGSRCSVMTFDGTNWVFAGDAGFSAGAINTPNLVLDASGNPNVVFKDALYANKTTFMKLCTSFSSTISSSNSGIPVCGSGMINLSATSATGTIRWYDAAANGLYLTSGTSYTTPVISTTTTYSVAAYDGNGCASPRVIITALVKPIPIVASTTPSGVCVSGTVTLRATPSAGTINWFSSPTGGSSLGTGTTFVTSSISTATTYYAEAFNNGCLSTSRTAVLASIYSLPSAPAANNNFRCGPGTVDISVNVTSGTVNWYGTAAGGTLLGTGTSFTTPTISSNTNYYAEYTNSLGCTSSTRSVVSAFVTQIPTLTIVSGNNCGSGAVLLTATGATTVNWFTQSTGGTSIFVGTNFTTPILTATTTYYAEGDNGGCSSTSRVPVVATINPMPTVTANDVSRCDNGTVTLTASSNGAINWYVINFGATLVGSGTTFTTPTLSATTDYYVDATLNGCTLTPRVLVKAIVNPTPPQPTITSNNSNPAAPLLMSSSTTGNQWFKDDVIVAVATNNTYTISQAGSYKVQVTLNGCVSPFSAPLAFIVTGLEAPTSKSVSLYPNPTHEELVVSLTGFETNKPVAISIIDFLGRELKNTSCQGGEEVRLDVRTYPSGQYFVLMHQGQSRVVKSFIKTL